MKKLLTLLIALLTVTSVMSQISYTPPTGVGRIHVRETLPAAKPNSFQAADFMFVLSDSSTYQWLGGGWQYSMLQFRGMNGKDGVNGKDGRDGANGTCPPCPPSGTGISKSIGTLRFVETATEMQDALNGWSNGTVTAIYVVRDIAVTSTLIIPKTTTARSKELIVFLNGNALYDASPSGLAILMGRIATSQAEADQMQSVSVIIRDGAFIGKAGTGVLLDIAATYGSHYEALHFENANEGQHLRFGLMSMTMSCLATNIGESFIQDYGKSWGGSTSNSQSNSSTRINCRDFGRANGEAAFSDYAVSGGYNLNTIAEGANKKYGWKVRSEGSPVVKDGRSVSSHLEMQPTIAGFDLDLSEGYYIVDGLFSQYTGTLVSARSSRGYPHVYVKNVPWHLGTHKYQTGSNAVIWSFDELHPTVDPSQSTAWVGGTMPYYWSVTGFNQSPFHKFNSFSAAGNETHTSLTMQTLVTNNLTTSGTVNLNGTVKINSKNPVVQ
jgi:hypothetical protein